MPTFLTKVREVVIPVIRVLGFVWESSRKWTLGYLVLLLLQALLPLAMLLLLKRIVDDLTMEGSTVSEIDFSSVLMLVLLYAGIWFLTSALQALIRYVSEIQQHLVMDHMVELLQEKSIGLDLAYYENHEYQDTFHKAQNEAQYRPVEVLRNLFDLLQNGISLLSILGLLVFLHWGIALLLIVAALPGVFIKMHFARVLYEWEKNRVGLERRSRYLNYLLTLDIYAKEVRIFDFGKKLIQQYQQLRRLLFKEKARILKRRVVGDITGKTSELAAVGGTFGYLAWRTFRGTVTIGDLLMYFQAFQRGIGHLSQFFQALARLYQSRLFLNFLFDFLELESDISDPPQPSSLPTPLKKGIEFENVEFHYPLTQQEVIRNVSLSIPAGSVVALVGLNGSGKTTLIKLLCRLYDVSGGAIRMDGVDIRSTARAELRRKISVIFQDFAYYQMAVRENLHMGDRQRPLDEDLMRWAAGITGADSFIRQLPKEYDNLLGRQFKGGAELSGGQWQKIALARALYRDSEILILDEPTSAIDPLAEYRIFSELKALAKDKIVILITHRLYNLKMADKIFVLDEGRLVEEGTHEALVQRDGHYARLFEKQMV